MPRPRRGIPLHLRLAFALLLVALPAGAALPDAATDTWVEARAGHVTVYSNAGTEAATRTVRHLERLVQVLEVTFPDLHADRRRDVRVYQFRDLDSFSPYQPAAVVENGQYGAIAGFHSSGLDVTLIAYHIPPAFNGDPLRVVSNQYVHVALSQSLGTPSVWISEGLAEFYGAFTASGRAANIGRPVSDHVEYLKANGAVSLDQLMGMDAMLADWSFGSHRGLLYAESWAMVHMMMMSPGSDAGRLSRYLAALGRGAGDRTALSEVYGAHATDSLSSALRAYVQQGTYRDSTWSFSDDLANISVSARKLPKAETLSLLGELAMRSSRGLLPIAREHLEAAWRADSSSALAAGLLCELAGLASDPVAAARWASAVERTPHAEPRARALADTALAQLARRTPAGAEGQGKGAAPPGSPADPQIHVQRALEAAKRGDYVTAESEAEMARGIAGPGRRADVENIAREIRNQRRLRSAITSLSAGKVAEACAFYDQVLADAPKPDVREYVLRQQLKYCGGEKPK